MRRRHRRDRRPVAISHAPGPLEIVEGYYLSRIVHHLHRCGALDALAEGATVDELAARHDYDAVRLRAVLELACERTGIVARAEGGEYRLDPRYATHARLGFHLDRLVGAYGPLLDSLDEVLSRRADPRELVDEQALADAFSRLGAGTAAASAHVLREWEVGSLLDLGCGPGRLLVEMACADPGFHGTGIDASASMCAAARALAAGRDAEQRVRVFCAPVQDTADVLDTRARESVGALHGRSLLNAFFGRGTAEASELVAMLGRLFPGRLLFVSDYYGRLGLRADLDGAFGQTLLQDVAQVLSGQGVPPPDLAGWAQVYHDARAELLHAYEDERDGVAWFIHVVRLPGAAPPPRA